MMPPERMPCGAKKERTVIKTLILLPILALLLSPPASAAVEREQAQHMLEQLQELFTPFAERWDRQLQIDVRWEMDHFFARALPIGKIDSLVIMGGVFHHPQVTEGVLLLTLCHELGHFYGEGPNVEGQADYFATAFCMKNYLHLYPQGGDDFISRAAITLGQILFEFEARAMHPPDPTTPDLVQVPQTLQDYPSLQCRLDTWLAGNHCQNEGIPPFERPQDHYCQDGPGKRPACWFAR